ncbi:type II toxin-antitoxin system VapC family toxin [Sphingomonas sp. RP10(2022)]|uniref:Type II toxin-antitoxin system VapC family toxin n=1 Tax=Sphingomonas liriopis TaxID=2949094 RepID=A0A9X2HN54_9SPHN|nr:type II toxin-antitoxin system VapC family toxin [Sphingomonas liriopis]MCP3734191.1 type II toxin-antitoxin system VapC family toxin [Sphingomonas liriopis]
MSAVVDASATMAIMLGETGAEMVRDVIRGSLMSAVNVSECCARGVERGASADMVLSILAMYEIAVVPFDLPLALEAARLREPTRAQGASLSDRACLALGWTRSLPIYTADRRLAEVDPALGIDIRLIR